MVAKTYTPERGDLVWLDFAPARGHEQSGRRPALVVSRQEYNVKSGLMLVCPATSAIKGYPFEVSVSVKDIRGAVLVDQMRSIDWKAREVTFVGSASKEEIEEILAKIFALVQ